MLSVYCLLITDYFAYQVLGQQSTFRAGLSGNNDKKIIIQLNKT